MSMISPLTWSDMATKEDLAGVEDRINVQMDARLARLEDRMNERMDARLARLEDRFTAVMHQEMNRQIWTMIGSLLALAAVLTANNVW